MHRAACSACAQCRSSAAGALPPAGDQAWVGCKRGAANCLEKALQSLAYRRAWRMPAGSAPSTARSAPPPAVLRQMRRCAAPPPPPSPAQEGRRSIAFCAWTGCSVGSGPAGSTPARPTPTCRSRQPPGSASAAAAATASASCSSEVFSLIRLMACPARPTNTNCARKASMCEHVNRVSWRSAHFTAGRAWGSPVQPTLGALPQKPEQRSRSPRRYRRRPCRRGRQANWALAQ